MFEDFSRSFVEKLNSWGLLVVKRHKALAHLKQQGFDKDFPTIYHVGQWYKPFSSWTEAEQAAGHHPSLKSEPQTLSSVHSYL